MTVQYQGVWTLQNAAQLQSTQRWVTDPLFENTTLLLQADDAANGAQNNTFLDSSSNSFAITRNGNTTQGSFTPFSQAPGWWSNFFDGATGTRFTLSSSSDFAFGTGAYTMEASVFITARGANDSVVFDCGSLANSAGLTVTTTGQIALGRYGVGNVFTSNAGDVPLNQWVHIAIVRTSTSTNDTRMYANGTLVATGTDNNNWSVTTTPGIGGINVSGFSLSGYISNLRIIKGSAVTPPTGGVTSPLRAVANTVLLTCQSNQFIDANTQVAAKTLTVNGTISVQAFSPFAPQFQWTPSVIGGSAYFDGTGDYLDSASNAALQLGSGDFSIEWWEYRDVVAAEDTPVSTGSYSSAYASCLLGYGGTAGLISTNGSSWNVLNAPAYIDTLNAKSWNHFVYTRSGTAFRVFMNGKLSNYATGSGSVVQNNNTFSVGGNAGGGQFHMPGYISGFRVVKGSIPTSYQTSSTTPGTIVFTPPTTPPTTTSQGATANNVGLVLNFTNAGIYDGTMKNNLETTGNVSVNTNVVKYGSGSIFFDGTGDYLTIPNAQQIVGTINTTTTLTIECWIYPTARPAFLESGLIGDMTPTASTNYWSFGPNQNGFLTWYSFSNATQTATSTLIPLNTWTHIAVSIQSGRIRLFVNGILQAFTGDAALTGTSGSVGYLTMGQWSNSSNYAYFGYVDDLRITRGVARYITSFTPPTVALPRQ